MENLSLKVLELTNKEQDVYNLLLKGFSKEKIAQIMVIEPTTVNTHFQHIFKKKIVNSKVELLAQRIQELEKEIKTLKNKRGIMTMRTEEEIKNELIKILQLQKEEKNTLGKIIYGTVINIFKWILGEDTL